ncbi:MAG: hypothetical protein UY63_C0013G0009 [Parcubacteria group bacterium GW2011_GWA2_51_10]|nr:MAG: hypothetical protein UY63_C0013G0009 [Parcubacteria group bacterium GW2011_GWA2_51_10]
MRCCNFEKKRPCQHAQGQQGGGLDRLRLVSHGLLSGTPLGERPAYRGSSWIPRWCLSASGPGHRLVTVHDEVEAVVSIRFPCKDLRVFHVGLLKKLRPFHIPIQLTSRQSTDVDTFARLVAHSRCCAQYVLHSAWWPQRFLVPTRSSLARLHILKGAVVCWRNVSFQC